MYLQYLDFIIFVLANCGTAMDQQWTLVPPTLQHACDTVTKLYNLILGKVGELLGPLEICDS